MSSGWHQQGQPSIMGALIQSHDWTATRLGPPDLWAEPLQSMLGLCLNAEFPFALWWGDDLIQIYNDSFRQAIGSSRHDAGFARPLASGWPDIWPLLSHPVQRIIGGESLVRLRDLPLLPPAADRGEPNGFFSMSLMPLHSGGRLNGIAACFHEAVPWEAVDRSQAFLIGFHEALDEIRLAADMVTVGCEMLGLYDGLEGIALAVFEPGSAHGLLWPEWPGERAEPRALPLADCGQTRVAAWQSGRPTFSAETDDLEGDPFGADCLSLQLPVFLHGRLAAVLFARAARPRSWARDEIALLRDAVREVLRGLARLESETTAVRWAARFETLAEALPVLVWRSAPRGEWIWASAQWCEFTGLSAVESTGMGWLDAFHRDDRQMLRSAWEAAELSGALVAEGRLRRASDGRFVWVRLRAKPLGTVAGEWLGTCDEADVARATHVRARREAEQRVGRTLSLVRALARSNAAPEAASDFAMRIDGYLDVVSRVQALVTGTADGDVDLDFAVAEELGAQGAHENGVIRLDGPSVRLDHGEALAVCLVVHDLTANAATDGALAGEHGLIRIQWQVTQDRAGRRLRFSWEEHGARTPVGSSLPDLSGMDRVLAREFAAATTLQRREDGFICCVTLPLGARRE